MKRIITILLSLFRQIIHFAGFRKYRIRVTVQKKKKNQSPRQLEQQQKFTLISQLISPMLPFLPLTYAHVFGSMDPCDKAFAFNIRNAITDTYPKCRIDFDAVKVSRGQLYNSHTADSYYASGKIHFSWRNLKINNASDNDISVLVVYCPIKKKCIYDLNGSIRMEEKAKLDVSEFKGHVVHSYLSFMAANGLMNSDSKYTGRHIIN